MSRNREPDSDPELVMTESESDERVRVASIAIRLKDARVAMESMHGKVRVLEAAQSSTTNRVESLEGSRKVLMAVIGVVATAALGAIWTAYTATRDSGEKAGRNEQRLEQLEHEVERITDQLQRLWTFRGRQGDTQP